MIKTAGCIKHPAVSSHIKRKWCKCGVNLLFQGTETKLYQGFQRLFPYSAVADEKYSCHILKPLECIDIPGIAGILRYFLLFILLAYPGIK